MPTIAPSIVWENGGRDSGELAATLYTLGIPHPPSYPTYVLLGHIWSKIPLAQEPAYRLNLFSLFSMGASIALLSFSFVHSRIVFTLINMVLTIGMFATIPLVWQHAIITEVYALGLLFLALYTMRLKRLQPTKTAHLGIILGLGLGAAPQLICAVPTSISIIRNNQRWHSLGKWCLGLLVGLSVYLYLPLRASMSPLFNWGNPDTLGRFWATITAQQYQHFWTIEGSFGRFQDSLTLLFHAFRGWGLPLVLFGGTVALRESTRWTIYCLLIVLSSFVFYLFYPVDDSAAYLLPAFYISAIFMGLGIKWLLQHSEKLFPPLFFYCLLAVVSCYTLLQIQEIKPLVDLSQNQEALKFGSETLSSLPQGAFILSDQDNTTFSLWYQQALGYRRDVVVIDTRLLSYSWYQDNIIKNYPELTYDTVHLGGLTAANRPIYDISSPSQINLIYEGEK